MIAAEFLRRQTRSQLRPLEADSARRFLPLDGLRGIAILLVLMHHCFPTTNHSAFSRLLARVVDAGWIGVDLFFVLSGFLITGILIETKGNAHFYRNFYMRRALRILPLYYAFLLIHQFVALTTARPNPQGFPSPRPLSWPIGAFLTNMPEIFPVGPLIGELGPLWSLAVEEQVYLFLPFLVAGLSTKTLLRVLIAIVPAALLWRLVVLAGFMRPEVAYTWMPSRLDAFAAGGIAAILVRKPEHFSWIQMQARMAFKSSTLFLVAMIAVQGHFHIWENMRSILSVGISALAVFFGSILAISVTSDEDSPLNLFLSARFLRTLGRYSYAMYLFHTAIFSALHPWILGRLGPKLAPWSVFASTIIFLVVLAATFFAAKASGAFFEGPILRLKRAFPRVIRPTQSAPHLVI